MVESGVGVPFRSVCTVVLTGPPGPFPPTPPAPPAPVPPSGAVAPFLDEV